MENLHQIVYSKYVVEFVAVANEYCVLIENTDQQVRKEFIEKMHRILPLLYLKATMLPYTESIYDDFLDKYVSEDIYDSLKARIEYKMGQYDAYTDVFNEDFQYSEAPVSSSVSEDLADIYQDVKDFLMTYSSSTDEIMNDGIWECQNNFKLYWGQKLTNTLRALHSVFYSENEIEEDDDEHEEQMIDQDEELENIDTKSWIISQRQRDFQEGKGFNTNPDE